MSRQMRGGLRSTSFKPGQSGNPGGRKKIPEDVREAARAMTKQAIEVLATVMRNPKESGAARVSAAVHLLDRGWGKPHQESTVNVNHNDVREWTRAELVAFLEGARKQEPAEGVPVVTYTV